MLGLDEAADSDPCRLVLCHHGSAERFTLQAANTEVKQLWVKHIQEVLEAQSNFLTGEETTHTPMCASVFICNRCISYTTWLNTATAAMLF